MKIKRSHWISWGLGALLMAGTAVHAEGYSSGGGIEASDESGERPGGAENSGAGREEMAGRIQKELGLSEEQAKQLREHREAHRKAAQALFEEARTKREALKAELEKPNFDENRVKSLQADVKAVREKMADHRLQGILEVRKILTPEQFAKFQQMTKERMSQRQGEGGGRRMGGGRMGGMRGSTNNQ